MNPGHFPPGPGDRNPVKAFDFFDDFDSVRSSTAPTHWIDLNGGTTGSYSIPATSQAQHPGMGSLNTGANAAGRMSIQRSAHGILLGSYQFTWEALVEILDLSAVAEEYRDYAGLYQSPDPVASTDGVYFLYDRPTSVNWLLVTEQGGITTVRDTGIPAVVGWQKLKFVVNAAATSIQAFINGVAAGAPITTTIPTAQIWPLASILKSAGVTNRIFRFDYVRYGFKVTR